MTGSILRLFYNGWVPFRIIVEQIALMIGLIPAMPLLGRGLSIGKKSCSSCALGGLSVFLIRTFLLFRAGLALGAEETLGLKRPRE